MFVTGVIVGTVVGSALAVVAVTVAAAPHRPGRRLEPAVWSWPAASASRYRRLDRFSQN